MSATGDPGIDAPQPARRHAATQGGIRASDAEREEVVACLHRALGDGRLDLDETDTRVAAAYRAVYRDDLPDLLADLPEGPAHVREGSHHVPESWRGIWMMVVWRARLAVWGDGAAAAPTVAHQRMAGALTGLALLWVALCALLGAVLVAS